MPAKKLPTSKLKRKRDTRPSAAKRGYNYQWQKSRKKRLRRGAKCSCGKAASHFHHQPSGRTVPKCASCHNSLTARKHRKGTKKVTPMRNPKKGKRKTRATGKRRK